MRCTLEGQPAYESTCSSQVQDTGSPSAESSRDGFGRGGHSAHHLMGRGPAVGTGQEPP